MTIARLVGKIIRAVILACVGTLGLVGGTAGEASAQPKEKAHRICWWLPGAQCPADGTPTKGSKPDGEKAIRICWWLPSGQCPEEPADPGPEPVLPTSPHAESATPDSVPPVATAPAVQRPAGVPGHVLDFCAIGAGKGDEGRYQRQRLVLFDLDGQDIAHAEEIEVNEKGEPVGKHEVRKAVGAFNHVREVFLTAFPMPRFYNVVTMRPAPPKLVNAPSLSADAMVSAVGDDRFAAYSIACADWIAVPKLLAQEATWSQVKKTRRVDGKSVEYLAYGLKVIWRVQITLFRREEGGWTRAATVEADNGGLLGAAFALASQAIQGNAGARDSSYISDRPDVSCLIPTRLDAGAAGSLAVCAGLALDFDLGDAHAPGTGQNDSPYCQGILDDVSRGKKAMEAVARCSSRVAMEQATLAVQKETKKVDGWRLFAPLQRVRDEDDDALGISLGEQEGAARGDTYMSVVAGPNGELETTGFARVVRVGPGGRAGETDPSLITFRAGEEPVGTRMEEHPQIGVVFGLAPRFALFTNSGDLGSTAFGGAIMGGYDASKFIDLADEVWSRIYAAMLIGDHSTRYISIDLLPEFTLYGPRRLNFFGGLGFGYLAVTAKEKDALEAEQDVSGATYGAVARAGLELILSPDIHARLAAAYRQNFAEAELKTKDEEVLGSAGTASGLGFDLSAAYTF